MDKPLPPTKQVKQSGLALTNDDIVAIKVNEVEQQLKGKIAASEERCRLLNEEYNKTELELIDEIDQLARSQFDSTLIDTAVKALTALGMHVEADVVWGKGLSKRSDVRLGLMDCAGPFGMFGMSFMEYGYGPINPFFESRVTRQDKMNADRERFARESRQHDRDKLHEFEDSMMEESKKIPQKIEAALYFRPKEITKHEVGIGSGHLRDAYMPLPVVADLLEQFAYMVKKEFELSDAVQAKMKKHKQIKVDYDKEHAMCGEYEMQLRNLDVIERQAKAALAKHTLKSTKVGQKILDQLENVKRAEVIE